MTNSEKQLLNELKEAGFKFSDKTVLSLHCTHLAIAISKNSETERMLFASDINIYFRDTSEENRDVKIGVASSHSFSPKNMASYWRIIHAATILKNWDKFIEISLPYIKSN